MSAELVDPFARPPVYRVSATDMVEAISYRVSDFRTEQQDPVLLPQIIGRTLRELHRAAEDGTPEVATWARWLLNDLWHRSESGVPYGEPVEPADSLDTERRLPRAYQSDDQIGVVTS